MRRSSSPCAPTLDPSTPRAGFEPAAYSLGGSRSIRLSYRGSLGLIEEALCGQPVDPPVPRLELEVALVAQSLHRVHRDEREAAVLDRRLVNDLAVELRGRDDRAPHERHPPHQRDVTGASAIRAPRPDHGVVEVDLPLRIRLRDDVGEIGGGAPPARLLLLRPPRGDVTEKPHPGFPLPL